MSAGEVVRQAATLMRERAEAATPGRWYDEHGGYVFDATRGYLVASVGDVDADSEGWAGPNQRHIASWHPTVALAVADWLRMTADLTEPDELDEYHPALAVARAYLQEQQP